ncbi:MAG: hypothetical protein MJ252_00710 [archaeon]|nr:hypothetical protein [archaeon]
MDFSESKYKVNKPTQGKSNSSKAIKSNKNTKPYYGYKIPWRANNYGVRTGLKNKRANLSAEKRRIDPKRTDSNHGKKTHHNHTNSSFSGYEEKKRYNVKGINPKPFNSPDERQRKRNLNSFLDSGNKNYFNSSVKGKERNKVKTNNKLNKSMENPHINKYERRNISPSNSKENVKKNLIDKDKRKIIKKELLPKVASIQSIKYDGESYSYKRILEDIKGIFGEDLENFDPSFLLSNLDKTSTEGLIKGLVLLAYNQEKEIKKYKEDIKILKISWDSHLDSKEEIIELLTGQIEKLNSYLKEISSDNTTLLQKITH